MRLRWQIGLLLGVALSVYANSIFNQFTFDDELYILNNAQVTQHSIRLLLKPNKVTNVYRPVSFATLAANWIVAGYKPLSYHLLNVLLNAAVVLVFLFLLRNVLHGVANGEMICFAAALLFAVHPIHTEAVSSIVGRAELLAAGFLLVAWLFHLQDRWILSLVCFALAMLSKESAIGLLPLALAGDYVKGSLKPWYRYGAIAGVTLLYIGLLWKVQGGHFGPASVSVLDNPLILVPAHLRILNAIHIAWKYIGLLIFPATLSCDYSYNQIYVYGSVGHLLIPFLAAVCLIAAWVWAIWTRRTGYIVAGAIFFAGFAATSNILTRTGTIFGERLAYLPSAGFCLLLALACERLARRKHAVALSIFALAAVGFAVRTVVRNRDWRDNDTLYSSAANAVPNSAKMREFHAMVYIEHNDLDRARADLKVALSIYPDYPDGIEGMGLVAVRAGDQKAALTFLQKALDISDPADFFYDFRAVNLAALELQMGKLDDAMKLLNREIAVSPSYSRAWSNRAVLHLKLGQLAEAREDARAALRIDPENAQATNVLNRQPGPLIN